MRARCIHAGPVHFDRESGALLRAPRPGCTCGIYAFKAEGNDDYAGLPVWGTVRLWGRIIEHGEGYRAEFAYPHELHAEDVRVAARIRFLYGVACEVAIPTTQSTLGRVGFHPAGHRAGMSSIVGVSSVVGMSSSFAGPPAGGKRRRWWHV